MGKLVCVTSAELEEMKYGNKIVLGNLCILNNLRVLLTFKNTVMCMKTKTLKLTTLDLEIPKPCL